MDPTKVTLNFDTWQVYALDCMAVSRCKSCNVQRIDQLMCTNSLHDILCKLVYCPRNFIP